MPHIDKPQIEIVGTNRVPGTKLGTTGLSLQQHTAAY